MGGPLRPYEISRALDRATGLVVRNGLVAIQGFEHLIPRSTERVVSHRRLNGQARAIAASFAHTLARSCPLVDCIALSGSAANGGYRMGDDIDFDLFVADGAKYLVYALSILLGALYSLRHRKRYGLRKLICTNVVWTQDQVLPFGRQDENLAFELLHCVPLVNSEYFERVIRGNGWVLRFFPQLERPHGSPTSRPIPNALGRAILWLSHRPRRLARANALARSISYAVYTMAHWVQHRDPAVRQRFEYLSRVKYPYEVFQD